MKKFKEDLLKLAEKYKMTFIENITKSNKKIKIKLIFNKFDLQFDKELMDMFRNNKFLKNKEKNLSLTYNIFE